MALFDVRCRSCGVIEEQVIKLNSGSMPCSSCGGETEKIFTKAPGIAFIGSGWTGKFYDK